MIDDTLVKLESRIRGLNAVPEEKRTELASLIGDLREEVRKLSAAQAGEAESIARFAELSAHEATRPQANPALQQLSIEGLAVSVKGFEASHPRLVERVNAICDVLASLGI
jgi:hypothetical protein